MSALLHFIAAAGALSSAGFLIGAALGTLAERRQRASGNPFIYQPLTPRHEAWAIAAMLALAIVTIIAVIAGDLK